MFSRQYTRHVGEKFHSDGSVRTFPAAKELEAGANVLLQTIIKLANLTE